MFVLLAGATVGPRRLRVAHPRKQVTEAPSIELDGELPAEHELEVFGHYHLGHTAGGARRLARR
ncbi:MAG: hypothetical protein ACFCVG_10550 [Kineosporiaceae bacterium]